MSHHAVVWLDHHEARVIALKADSLDEGNAHAPTHHIHSHAPTESKEADPHYFQDLAKALASYKEILVVGPSTAKLQFVKYVHKHAHELEPKIIGVETVDHPTDGQVVAYAKKYFRSADLYR